MEICKGCGKLVAGSRVELCYYDYYDDYKTMLCHSCAFSMREATTYYEFNNWLSSLYIVDNLPAKPLKVLTPRYVF